PAGSLPCNRPVERPGRSSHSRVRKVVSCGVSAAGANCATRIADHSRRRDRRRAGPARCMIAVLVLLQLMWIQPDAQRTPGKVNPDITQGNIADNICSNKWSTGQIRPLSDYTRKLKLDQMQQYGDSVPDEAERCVSRSNNPKCL